MKLSVNVFWGVLFVILSASAVFAEAQEWNTDRPGMNIRNFDLSAADPKLCEDACKADPNCKAYTYVKPGVQGANARCWLKSGVPSPVKNSCCVSGIISRTVITGTVSVAPPSTGQGTTGNPLGAIWEEKEGAWTSIWTRRGTSNVFDAEWKKMGALMGSSSQVSVTAVLTIYVQGNSVTVNRRQSSDGNDCDYTGTLAKDGNSVQGTYKCSNSNQRMNWSAYIRPSTETPTGDTFGTRWQELEGEWQGNWIRRGMSNTFDAEWVNRSGKKVKATLTISQDGNIIMITRRKGSDGNDCGYTGFLISSNRVEGAYICTNSSQPGSWTAFIRQ
jgi:hypothetical protein